MQEKRMLVIDGNSVLNRAFYGIRPLTASDGLFTQAIYGMMNMILKQTEALCPDYAVIAFDTHAPTFRHKADADYKATRRGMPEELAVQFPYAKKCAEAFGLLLVEKEGYEADDILGTFSRLAEKEDVHAYLFTGDRDSLQLITDKTSVLLASTGETAEYTPESFYGEYGVRPEQFVYVKALMGDSSDNIPGVAGIGKKTALKLISDFGDLDSLYENYESSSLSAGVKEKLRVGKESAYKSLFLSKIVTDVPMGYTLADAEYRGVKEEQMIPLLRRLELFSLIDRLSLKETKKENEYQQKTVQDVRRGRVYGAYIAKGELFLAGKDEHIKIPFEDIKELSELFENREYRLIMSECKEKWHELDRCGVRLNSCFFDTALAGYVLDSNASTYTTERLVKTYLSGKESDEADELYRLWEVMSEKIEETGAHRVYYDIEHPCSSVLAEMEKAGFKVDKNGLVEYSEMLTKKAAELEERIYIEAGQEFNINSPKQLGVVLFEKLGIPAPKKTKNGYSTAADVLEKLRAFYPIVDDILEYRKVTKLNSTYAVGLYNAADEKGRVHTSFKQTVTATGRLSSTEPNLQNIPIKTELGKELRKYFIPEEGMLLIDADYSQIELRLLAVISDDEAMKNAFLNDVDIHTLTASEAFRVPIEQVTPQMRKAAKAVNFGIVYGIGDFTLAKDLGVSRKEAAAYIESYMKTYPGVADYLKKIVEKAKEDGYVTTEYGRRRYIPELSSGKAALRSFGERVAMNSPIQGTAADLMKCAMVNVSRALKEAKINARLILQVHDELVIEAEASCADQAAIILKREMENAAKVDIPLKAETTVGETWYENK